MRNLLTNGGFEFDQANEGSVVTLAQYPAAGHAKYCADGWYGSNLCSVIPASTVQRLTNTASDAPRYSQRLTVTTPTTSALAHGDELRIYTPIGAEDGIALMYGTQYAKETSVSFKVKSSIAGTFVFTLANGNPDPSHRRCLYKMFTISAADTWQTVTIDGIPGCTDGDWPLGTGIWGYLLFQTCVGTDYVDTTSNEKAWRPIHVACDNTIDNTMHTINGAYLEVGDVFWTATATAQPFEYDPHEFERCQRRYQKSYDRGVKPGSTGTAPTAFKGSGYQYFNVSGGTIDSVGVSERFQTSMVGSPAVTMYSPITGASGNIRNFSGSDSSITVYMAGTQGFNFYVNGTVPTPLSILWHYVADSRL